MLTITRYARIRDNKAWLDGNLVFSSPEADTSLVLRSLFRKMKISYPKFFKMDELSRLGFLAAELIMGGMDLHDRCRGEDMAIILQNGSSSLESDERHQEMISDREKYYPSPSVFVYTLPNIAVGEIAIRHHIEGENAVFISKKFDPAYLEMMVKDLFFRNKIRCALAGWLEYFDGTCEAFLALVEEQNDSPETEPKESIIFDAQNLEKLFNVF